MAIQRLADGIVHGEHDGDWRALSWRRTASCGRSVVADDGRVGVRCDGSKAWFTGVARCGSVWTCEGCRATILGARAQQLEAMSEAHHARGGKTSMLTLTVRHRVTDRLVDLRRAMAESWRSLQQSAHWRAFRAARLDGMVVAREVTTSLELRNSGWHVHYHVLLFWAPGASDRELRRSGRQMERWVRRAWAERVERRLGVRPTWRGTHHRWMSAKDAGYVSKIAAEVARGDHKTNDALRVLAQGVQDGEAVAIARWLEWAEGMSGAHSIHVSRELRSMYPADDLDDAANEAIVERDHGGELRATLDRPAYLAARKRIGADGRRVAVAILEDCEDGIVHPLVTVAEPEPVHEPPPREVARWVRQRDHSPRPLNVERRARGAAAVGLDESGLAVAGAVALV